MYKIISEKGLDGWSDASVSWSPWHQDRPLIKARVINPDGQAYTFEPSDLVEGREGGNLDTGVSSDRNR